MADLNHCFSTFYRCCCLCRCSCRCRCCCWGCFSHWKAPGFAPHRRRKRENKGKEKVSSVWLQRKWEKKEARCDWSAHRVFRFLFVVFFCFLWICFFFTYFRIFNSTTNPYGFFFDRVVFALISLIAFCQSVVHVVLHLIVQFKESSLFTWDLETLISESGGSRQLRGDRRLQLTR